MLQARAMRVLVASQMLGGAGLAAGVTVGALLAEDMLGSTRFSGLPAALFTIGAAAAALLVGRVSQRSGRRVGLAGGYLAGALGGLGVVVAAVIDSAPLLLAALLVYGSGVATNLQARYAGSDLARPERRGRAVSMILLATAAGAIAGPNLVEVTGELAAAVGIPRLAGPFALAALVYALAALVLIALLRPDPLLVARALAARPPGGVRAASEARAIEPAEQTPAEQEPATRRGTLALGASAMILTQIVMVAVMTMTPIHMRDHGHDLGQTGLVIAIHIACMYLPSPLTGALADRFGRPPVIVAGALALVAAGVVAALAPTDSVWLLALALGLLGLGWNLGLIGGTALVADAVPVETGARTQGTIDLGVALAGSAGGLSSGVVVASASFAALSLAGGVVALLILPVVVAAPLSWRPLARGPTPG